MLLKPISAAPIKDGARLIVGVTAHRDIVPAIVPQLERDVRAFLQRLRDEHPQLPITVMSGLAEGGDRLVARCAIELGLPLVAVLPLSRTEYALDFTSPDSRLEFEALLSSAEVVELPLAAGDTPESVREPGSSRDRQYAQLGVYVSSHCQVLLALWDGRRSDAAGGTSDVVTYHLRGVMSCLGNPDAPPNLLADDDSDLVFHIACPRERENGHLDEPLRARWLTCAGESPGEGPLPETYRRMFRQLGEFNGDAQKYAAAIAAGGSSLLPADAGIDWPRSALSIDALYVRADWLALHFRRRVHHSLLFLHTSAVLTGLAFILYSEFDAWRGYLVALLALFAGAVALARIGSRREWHRRYLDYRVLAEGLRVQCYWTIAEVPAAYRVGFAYDSFLQKQDVELGWIRHVMRVANLGERPLTATGGSGLRWVIDHWVGDGGDTGQLGYFRRRSAERERKYRHTEVLGRLSLMLSLACALILLVADSVLTEDMGRALLVVMGAAALFAGVREAYSHKLADKELIKQYRFMSRIFAGAAKRLAKARLPAVQHQVLEALGQAALEEHAEWILMHRERPLEHNRLG